jgi:hypothetical protein
MSNVPEIPLLIIGKDSLFPFTGMFFAKEYSNQGWCHIVGRCYEADVKKDFLALRQFENRLQHYLSTLKNTPPKEQLQAIWDRTKQESLPVSISTMVCLIAMDDQLILGGFGVSGLWGSNKNAWYPLLPDFHPLYEEESIEGNLDCLRFTTYPQQILIRPRPIKDRLSSIESLGQRIFEVSR